MFFTSDRMKFLFYIPVLLGVLIGVTPYVKAQVPPPMPIYQPQSPAQLDQLLGPIALYPNPLPRHLRRLRPTRITRNLTKSFSTFHIQPPPPPPPPLLLSSLTRSSPQLRRPTPIFPSHLPLSESIMRRLSVTNARSWLQPALPLEFLVLSLDFSMNTKFRKSGPM